MVGDDGGGDDDDEVDGDDFDFATMMSHRGDT